MATKHTFICYNPDGTEAYNGTFSYVPVSFVFGSNNIAIYDGEIHIDAIIINVTDVVRYKVVKGTETYYEVGETVEFPNNLGSTIYIYAEQAGTIEIPLTSPEGIRLCTKGTLCTKDIDVIPTLQSKTVTPTTAQQTITPDNGNAGLSEVVIEAIPSEYEIPTYFEDSGITVADS